MVGIMLHFYFCQVLLIHLQVCFRAPRQFVKVVEDFVETVVDALRRGARCMCISSAQQKLVTFAHFRVV